MSASKLIELAREAGVAGQRWHTWIMSDEVQDMIMAMPETPTDAEQEEMEAAFAAGRRAGSLANAKIIWTTAPKDFDGSGAVELEVVGDYFGKPLRKIAVDPDNYDWQMGRYGSSIYGLWEKDPLAEYNRLREEQAVRDAERAARESKHQAGLEWLKTATEEELENEDLCWEHGCQWQDIRNEKNRRHEAAETSARTSAWESAVALIPEGATLLDPGEYIRPTLPGLRPIQRDMHVYYDIKIVPGWPAEDVDKAHVSEASGRGRKEAGPVSYFADMISKGKIRVTQPGEVPPRAVVERIGHEQIKDIRRLEAAGKVVWGGRPRFGNEVLILDENGKLVRAKKVLEAAEDAYRAAEREHWDAIAAKTPSMPSSPGSGGDTGHAWGRSRSRRRHRSLRGRYGKSGWYGERSRHSAAARKGWHRRGR